MDVSSVTNMGGMLTQMPNITVSDLANWNTISATNMNALFGKSSNLTTIYASESFTTSNVTSTGKLFEDCNSLVGGNGTHYNSTYIYKDYAWIDGRNGKDGYFTDIADKP